MTIEVTCPCGAKLSVKLELSGKQVRCPTCSNTMTVPIRPTSLEKIRVTCRCGGAFKANAELAGEKVSCPKCGQSLAIPAPATVLTDPSTAAGPTDDPLGLGAIGFDASTVPALPRPEPVVPQPVDRPNPGRSSGTNSGRSPRGSTASSNPLDMVAGGFAVLHGVIACVGVIQMITTMARASSVIGVRAFAPLNLLGLVLSIVVSGCILMAGIGILTGRKKWALEFGQPASIVYLALLALSCMTMIWAAVQLNRVEALVPGVSRSITTGYIAAIPRMMASAIGPILLIVISSRSKGRR